MKEKTTEKSSFSIITTLERCGIQQQQQTHVFTQASKSAREAGGGKKSYQ
jgi:hypothetical protein